MRLYAAFAVMLFLVIPALGGDDALTTSATATLPARDAANFRPRANVERLIQAKRTQDEDKLRVALLACAQSDDELRALTAMVNGRWDKKSIETVGQWLAEDWDKEYGPSLRRPKCIFELLVYVRNHEKPYAFKDGEDVRVTVAEGRRLEQLTGNIDTALADYIDKLVDPKCKWPADSRSDLLYHIAATFEEHGAPEMITETIWKGMADCKKFRWDMLGVMSNLANQATLERLLKFRDSQEWAIDDMDRIDEGIRDVRWWLERAEIMAQSRQPEEEPKVVVSEEETKLMLKRVADAKAGRCPKFRAVGAFSDRTAIDALSLLYTKLNIPIAISASDTGDIGGMAAMVSEHADVMLLDDKPSTRAMELHGEKWNSLGVGKDGKPDGTGPTEYILAGQAAAIIVNPANKLESLTLGQIQAIFQGDVDDWAIIGGTELTPPAGPGGRPGTLGIHAFGLYARETATAIFEKECLARRKWRRVKYKKDTAEAVAAVSMDPQAIAFVDLSAIPATGQSVKVLPIKFGQGEKARNIAPTAENIKNAMYPLSQRYFLYVHPKASDTAKDFAKFISTCGGSEATPYADTVKAVTETYQKHGLIPLADEAITRAAKDALAEAAAKARAEEAAKARGKRR